MSETVKINLNEEVTSRLSLQPIKDSAGNILFGGLVPVKFLGAHITTQTPEKGQFTGIPCKVINFEFCNYKLNANEPDRFLTHSEKVVGSVKKEGAEYVALETDTINKIVKSMWGRIKHILDACKGLPNYRNIVEDKNFLKLIELPVTQDAKVLADAYNALFEYICAFFNGDGKTTKPMYWRSENTPLIAWAKILPEYESQKWYTFPTFVGTGFLEPATINKEGQILPASIIAVKPSESLELASGKAGKQTSAMPVIKTNEVPSNVANALGIG